MKTSGHCPKCKGDDLYVVAKIAQPNPRTVTTAFDMTAHAACAPSVKNSWLGEDKQRFEAGTFESWICARCGFTEWYAQGANQVLDYLVGLGHADVRRIKAGDGYR